MNDDEYQGPELQPLPHPELFNLDIETPEPEAPKASAPAPEAPKPAAPAPAKPAASKQSLPRRPAWQRIAYAFGAVVLYALLVNVAVEHVLQASPVRWGVVGAVGALLALTVLLWRRTGWPMKAGLAALTLLGLLTFGVWFAGDVNQGLMAVQQPPLVVVTAVPALMVALAGLWLIQHKMPWWDRLLIGIVAAYGAAAFVLPLVTNTAYPVLMGEGGFWEGVPFWLQGEFVGVLVVLPAALLVLLVTGLLRVRGTQLWGWGFKVAAFGLGLLLALEAFWGILPALP